MVSLCTCMLCTFKFWLVCAIIRDKTGGTNILVVRSAYSYSIVLVVLIIVFALKALINLYVCKVRVLVRP